MRMLRLTLAVMAAAAMIAPLAAQNPEADLQRAIQREEANGDLRAAIAEYQRIVAVSAASNPRVAARALLRQGDAHRSLGETARARSADERILREFPAEPAAMSLRPVLNAA